MTNEHHYSTTVRWTGNLGAGTSAYNAYSRNHEVSAPNKAAGIEGSSDPHFRGDKTRYNPEELLVAALSQCHLLAYLHLCATNKIVVETYEDNASGTMILAKDGSGRFTEVTLNPVVTISSESDEALAQELHHEAHRLCFIANSVNFSVTHIPRVARRR
ncbi:MAG: peroxiredoxin [Bryobacterales bacterium]|jgi:organic hydroperoxide reductase OsmC/OhrA|nr:peroxiredoxin [Bryobacterales bacterium]